VLIGEEPEVRFYILQWPIVHSGKELANLEPQGILRWWLMRLLVLISRATHDPPEVSGTSEVELGRYAVWKVDPEMPLDFHDYLNEI
jgi:hypothetical protein